MRLRGLILLTIAGATPAVAQQSAAPPKAPTVEQYLCTFAGKCSGPDGPVETRDAPATKGFRLARSVAGARPESASAPAPRAMGTRAVRGSVPRAADYGARPRAVSAPARSHASSGPRADLMIGFELNSARLTRDGAQAAQIFAQSLLRPELLSKRFRIEGHTDISGGRHVNGPLSSRRAQAVADYLVAMGVDRSRLDARGFGANRPLDGHTAADPANRRVEAELIF